MNRIFSHNNLITTSFVLIVLFASACMAKDYIIYSIAHDLPMGEPGQILKKNYYVNMGKKQGLDDGSTLDVFRNISRLDPYHSNKRYNYRFKVGQLKVIHSDENASISSFKKIDQGTDSPLIDIENFMIGDNVDVHVE